MAYVATKKTVIRLLHASALEQIMFNNNHARQLLYSAAIFLKLLYTAISCHVRVAFAATVIRIRCIQRNG